MVSKLKPKFWDHTDVAAGPYENLFNFRRIWKLVVVLTVIVTLGPLVTITLVDYNLTRKSMESTVVLRTSRFVSNTRRTVSFFLTERRSALDFIVRDHSLDELRQQVVLEAIFSNLKRVVGAFTDLGVIEPSGIQSTYVGPYELAGKNYRVQAWFSEVVESGVYISDVFMGYRKQPHLVIAVKQPTEDGSFFVLRASLDTKALTELLLELDISQSGDVFLMNRKGVLQTPSRRFGGVLEGFGHPVPEPAEHSRVYQFEDREGRPLIVAYAYVAETPLIVMVVQEMGELMEPWAEARLTLLGFLAASILVILLVILGVATHLVNQIFVADQKRVAALHSAEYSNKMASIGRLAAGVAHEINNPLAIINEKAGLIKDLFTFKRTYAEDPRLMATVDSIISSVDRCAKITKRLLSFSRKNEIEIQPVDLRAVVEEVLGFQTKEAEYRSIQVHVDIPDDMPRIQSVHGKLQEVFLNLIHNAFAALERGGRLDITVRRSSADGDHVEAVVADTGTGIPEEDLDRIFEPFFSTKTDIGGTGLGLSITRSLVMQLGGVIDVQSEVGVGTRFTVTLPIHPGGIRGTGEETSDGPAGG